MVYSVHGYYGKLNSRKAKSKIEAIVFAKDKELAEELVVRLFDGYPADLDYFSVVGGQEIDENTIYKQHPDFYGVDPARGCISNVQSHWNAIRRYFK